MCLPVQRVFPQWVHITLKLGSTKTMIWEYFDHSRNRDLVRKALTMEKHVQNSILVMHAVLLRIHFIGKDFTMQQNNDLKHCSYICQNELKDKENENILRMMTLP